MGKFILELVFCCWLGLVFASQGVAAHEGHGSPQKTALAASVAFDAQHRLWRVSVNNGYAQVDVSTDYGKTFGAPVRVNPAPEKIGADGELRPKIALGPKSEIYVSWTQALDRPYAGDIKFSRSLDGGRSFSTPLVVNYNRDVITHRFDSLAVADDGALYVAWIDKRDLHAAQAVRQPYVGAAIYYAVSGDGGASFSQEFKAGDSSCECCRIALAPTPGGKVAALWRHVFDGHTRDHAWAVLTRRGVEAAPRRATFGGWNIDACPHHGPALARDGERGWHMVWYDGGKPGLYYARMDEEGRARSPDLPFGDSEAQAGHPALLARGERVWLAWKELDRDGARIMLIVSADGGRSWSASRQAAYVQGASDYPLLVADGVGVYLSWNTAQGYRLVALP